MIYLRALLRFALFGLTGVVLLVGAAAIDFAHALPLAFTRARRVRADLLIARQGTKNAFLGRVMRALCRGCGISLHADAESLRLARFSARVTSLSLANHVSYLDVVVLGALLETSFLAKQEVASYPLVGAVGRGLGMIYVDRIALAQRVRTLFALRERLQTGNVCVFPEGTTTDGVTPDAALWQPGQLWAARPGSNRVVCFGLCYVDHSQLAWVGDMSLLPHMWSVFLRNETHVFISARELCLPPEAPRGASPGVRRDLRALSRQAHDTVRELCIKSHSRVVAFQQAHVEQSEMLVTKEVPSCKSIP